VAAWATMRSDLLMVDHELRSELDLIAIAKLESGQESSRVARAGVRLLDTWRDGRHGAVLFWVDRELDLSGFGQAVLRHVDSDPGRRRVAQPPRRGRWHL
jgi:hypothetical protein